MTNKTDRENTLPDEIGLAKHSDHWRDLEDGVGYYGSVDCLLLHPDTAQRILELATEIADFPKQGAVQLCKTTSNAQEIINILKGCGASETSIDIITGKKP